MNSRIVLFRLSLAEHEQLAKVADHRGETVSEAIREALYAKYRIGSLALPPSNQGDCNTPRT